MGEAKRLFGTDGIRGVAGEYPLDLKTVELIGRSLASNLTAQLGRLPAIVIGRDTRESGPRIEGALARGARSAGARVESVGVITTPGVAYVTRVTPFDAGVVISASHNPYQDNGIKVFSPTGKKLDDETERRIEGDLAARTGDQRGQESAGSPDILEARRDYVEQYINFLAGEVGGSLRLEGLRVCLDCANGAASAIAPRVFEALGAQVTVLSAEPDGHNINENCGSLHPQTLCDAVVAGGLDLGIAFDGDADRTLLVDSTGALVDGDHLMLILADHMLSRDRLEGGVVVATVMSNVGLEIALRERGISLARAQVGDRYVLEELIARDAKLGGEQSGHIIFPDISLAGDGIITATEALRAVRDSGRTLNDLASQMKRFPQVLVNVRVRSKPPLESLPAVRAEVERLEEEMQGRGRSLVRYSGTENLARVMIEGEDQEVIERQANRLAQVIEQEIG